MSYWVAVVAKNAEKHLSPTLDSLISQTKKPERIIIIDDGSTDSTPEFLVRYMKKYPALVNCVTLPDRGYDIRRVPRNINLAWKTAEAEGLRTRYFMISGDDCIYQSNYAETLMSRMNLAPKVVVTSGRAGSEITLFQEHVPSGSGRMVKCSFWREIGEAYPVKAGWETWLLYLALEWGFDVKLDAEVAFQHVRPRGAKHQFVYWGAAMHGLGYHPLYAIGRIAKNALIRSMSLKGTVSMLRGYAQAQLGSADAFMAPFESSLRDFVRKAQALWIKKLVVKML